MMTSTKAVKMLIATTHNSPFQDSPHPDNQGFYGPVLRGLNVMPCDFRYWAPFWTGWLAGYMAQIALVSCANLFLAAES